MRDADRRGYNTLEFRRNFRPVEITAEMLPPNGAVRGKCEHRE